MALNIKEYFFDKSFRMQALMGLPPGQYIKNASENFDPSRSLYVDMYEAAITTAYSKYPTLGTTSLTTCMGVAAHNAANGLTGLAHLVQQEGGFELSIESEKSLSAMLNQLRGETIQVRLIGPSIGGSLAYPFIDNVADILAEYDAYILSADFGVKQSTRDVAVDSSRWNEGLIKVKIDLSQISTFRGCVDGELCYNGSKEIQNLDCIPSL